MAKRGKRKLRACRRVKGGGCLCRTAGRPVFAKRSRCKGRRKRAKK